MELRSTWQSVFVVPENLVLSPVVDYLQFGPAPTDIGQVVQQGGSMGLVAKSTKSFGDGSLRRHLNGLTCQLRKASS